MTQELQERVGGGTFLTRALVADDMLTRDELTDEQRLFGQTAAEFMRNEVVPNESRLYAHDWVLTRQLLKEPARIRQTGQRIGQRFFLRLLEHHCVVNDGRRLLTHTFEQSCMSLGVEARFGVINRECSYQPVAVEERAYEC